jgi:hypothetical protein
MGAVLGGVVMMAASSCSGGIYRGTGGYGGGVNPGGGTPCETCGDYLSDGVGPLCEEDFVHYDELINCICNGPCAADCATDSFCDANGSQEAACDSCILASSGCAPEHSTCTGDVNTCVTCSEYLTSTTGVVCQGASSDLYNEFIGCVCVGPCAADCAMDAFCATDGVADPACDSCIQDNAGCYPEYTACANDF